jgi:hypothetical protein
VSIGPTIKMSSIQSSPSKSNTNLKTKPSSSNVLQPPQTPFNSLISLRPQVLTPKQGIFGHDKHKLGCVSDLQGTSELGDPFEGTEYSDKRGRNRVDSKGSATCVGMVRRRDGSSLVRDSSSSPSNRFSRSPSPNRYGVVTRDKPLLEFSHGCPENRRDKLSTANSLSAIVGAEISAISGGGVLCNSSRVRREEGAAVKSNSSHLEMTSEVTKVNSACEMHSSIQDKDKLVKNEGGGNTILSVCYGSDSEQSMGDVAGEGMEFARGGGHAVPNSKPYFYVVQ